MISRRSSSTSEEENTVEDQSSLRILRWVAKSLIERVEDFKPQEISNSIWAFATLGFGATTTSGQFNTNNEYISLPSDQPELDRKLVSETLLAVAKNSSTRLNRFRPQELNNLAWGFCRLGQYSDEMMTLYEGIGKEILRRHRSFAPQVCAQVDFHLFLLSILSTFELGDRYSRILEQHCGALQLWSILMKLCSRPLLPN